MSVSPIPDLPDRDAPERATAKETVYRLAAIAFGHPTPEFHAALTAGTFHRAFDAAWSAVTGSRWPAPAASPGIAELEAGFITAFLHGHKGKPVSSLLAGDYHHLLAGSTRPNLMLNIAAFYRHFGLAAAKDDEGRDDEPDHLASMLEFMAVLTHLEARALERGADAAPYRRAQRDFLQRYLTPLLHAIRDRLRRYKVEDLDPTIAGLVEDMADFSAGQAVELEVHVGPYRDPDCADAGLRPTMSGSNGKHAIDQNLWG